MDFKACLNSCANAGWVSWGEQTAVLAQEPDGCFVLNLGVTTEAASKGPMFVCLFFAFCFLVCDIFYLQASIC